MQTRGLSGSTLKLIAIVTMLIDHIGAAVVMRFLMSGKAGIESYMMYYNLYNTLRTIGRIAFPIFCFLLIEGFEYTKDRKKYALRLLLFAAISEIPFDLAFSSSMLEFDYQNVFFTLFIGLITIIAFHAVEEKVEWNPWLRIAVMMAIGFAGIMLAYFLRTDYDAKGVLCILALYLFRRQRGLQILAGCLAFGWFELPALVAFIPIAFYNGKRGWNIKYFFYLFYPLHLLLLYLICQCMGIAGIPAV